VGYCYEDAAEEDVGDGYGGDAFFWTDDGDDTGGEELEVEAETNAEAENVWIRGDSAGVFGVISFYSLKDTKDKNYAKGIAKC
jgi:hypothetical protein